MSVIVKGMEMPEECNVCPLANYNMGTMYCKALTPSSKGYHVIRFEGKREDCPLVEIPTPHGRLIDVDKLKSRLVLHGNSPEQAQLYANICEWIDLQETVIEAEGSEE